MSMEHWWIDTDEGKPKSCDQQTRKFSIKAIFCLSVRRNVTSYTVSYPEKACQ
jgi:hypothetical protein